MRLLGWVPKREAGQCMYGMSLGKGLCSTVVPPHQGQRFTGTVYCLEEHEMLDQLQSVY